MADGLLADLMRNHETPGMTKYLQLRQAITDGITSGRLPAGTRLPTEHEIAAETGLSLGTVQRALRDLAANGAIVRRTRVGSFVAERRRQIPYPLHCRFLAEDGRSVLPVYPVTQGRRTIRRPGPWSDHLGPSSSGYLFIERRFDVADEFSVASRFYCQADRFRFLTEPPLSELDGENFKLLIAERLGLPITRVVHRLGWADFDDPVRALTRSDAREGLQLDGIVHSGSGVLYFQRFLIPPNRRQLQFVESGDGT